MKARVLEWVRLDAAKGVARTVLLGGCVMALGLGVGLAGRATGWTGPRSEELVETPAARHSRALRELAVSTGTLTFSLLGGLIAIVGLSRTLREDRYLALREDGVILVADGVERFAAWDELAMVRFAEGQLELVPRDGEPIRVREPLAPEECAHLAQRAEEIRRRASLGLALRP